MCVEDLPAPTTPTGPVTVQKSFHYISLRAGLSQRPQAAKDPLVQTQLSHPRHTGRHALACSGCRLDRRVSQEASRIASYLRSGYFCRPKSGALRDMNHNKADMSHRRAGSC